MLNFCVIQGRLVRNPEIRQTTTGRAVCSFDVACSRDRKDANGERPCDFVTCVAWEKTAEFVGRYFTKGKQIIVAGRLQSRKFQDRDGNNRTAWEVVAQSVNFCDDSKPADDTGAPPAYGAPAAPAYAPPPYSPPAATNQPPLAYSAGSNDDFALIEDDGDMPF